MAASGDPYVSVSVSFSRWSPLAACTIAARWAWIAMLTSPDMRRACVGLFPGSVGVMAEATGMPFGEAVEALDELVDRGLVEHDAHNRIIRYTKLPDRADRPANGSVLVRWWKGFEILPQCATRDRHVSLIRWLCGEPFSKDHEKAWATTFGTVELHSRPNQKSATSGVVSQVSIPWSGSYDSNHIRHHGGHHQETETDTETVTDQGREHERGGYPQPLLPLAEGTNPGLASPILNARSMLGAIAAAAGPRVSFDLVDDRLLPQLESVAAQCCASGVTLADLDVAGRFLRAGGLAYRNDLGASWASRPGSVMDLVSSARRWKSGEIRLDGAQDDFEPTDPRPPSAFTTGVRTL
jgi:hypothetical protein